LLEPDRVLQLADQDEEAPASKTAPRVLEEMSIEALQAPILDLEQEIAPIDAVVTRNREAHKGAELEGYLCADKQPMDTFSLDETLSPVRHFRKKTLDTCS
jgi:hypothetical protein